MASEKIKNRPSQRKRLKTSDVSLKGDVLYKSSFEFLESLVDSEKVAVFYLIQNDVPNMMIVWQQQVFFLEMIHGKRKLDRTKEGSFGRLERSGARIVICRSTAAIVLTLKHWGIPLKFDWRI